MTAERPGTADVAIVVVGYNCRDWIGRCLDSLPAALEATTAEIVIVDNASSDGTADAAEQHGSVTTIIRNDTNAGFAAAVNQGVAASTAPWVLLLNPDTESRPGSLSALVNFATAHPGHGLYGGRTVRPDGGIEISSCWALPTLWSTFCLSAGLTSLFRRNPVFDPESLGHWDRDSVREVGMITGCLLLTPRTVWDELGGLDERYFVYGEDADLSARARSLGYQPIITPEAEIIHVVGVSSADDGGRTVLLMAGKITYAQRQWSGWQSVLAQHLLRYGVGLRAVIARLIGRRTKWRAAWDRRPEWWNGFPPRRTL